MDSVESIVNRFGEVISQILTCQSEMHVDDSLQSSMPTQQQSVATMGPHPEPESNVSLLSAFFSIPPVISLPPRAEEQFEGTALDLLGDVVEDTSNPENGFAMVCFKDDQLKASLQFDGGNFAAAAHMLHHPREDYLGIPEREESLGANAREENLGDDQREQDHDES